MKAQHLSAFLLIDFDGWNLGLVGAFAETLLEFHSYNDAVSVARHWQKWMLS
jgi:hypothetical protein